MDIQAYIESGILELYALEALSPVESREVEALAMQYPEIKAELERTQEAINRYALSYALEPRTELKQDILEKVQPRPIATPPPPANLGRNRLGLLGLLLAILAILVAVVFYSRSKRLEQEVQRVVAENQSLQNNYSRLLTNFEFINNPATKVIALAPPPEPVAPDARVTVYWNPQQRTTLLAIQNLPKPPAGKQYQLWAIKGKAAPAPAGMIDTTSATLQTMAQIGEADTFAITLENEGGSPVPTSPIYVLGNVI